MESVRVDRWLSAARLYKSRTQARDACVASRVKINGENAKPNQALKVGDRVEVQKVRIYRNVEVVAFAEKRLSPVAARELYIDHTPPPAPRPKRDAARDPGAGRPTKRDRRATERLKGRYEN